MFSPWVHQIEGSPRRGIATDSPGGNLAFYGEQEIIDGAAKEDDTSSSSYGAAKVATLFGSPKPQISMRSFDNDRSVSPKERSVSPKTGSTKNAGSTFSPPRLVPTGSFKGPPQQSPYRSRPSATDLQFTDINKSSRDDEDKPTDLRASFALKGRAPSYRSTTIVDSGSESIKVLVDDPHTLSAAAQAAAEEYDAAMASSALSRKVSRPGMPTFAAHSSDTGELLFECFKFVHIHKMRSDVALVEPAAPPPMLRANSKAFSFSKLAVGNNTSRPATSRQGGTDEDYYEQRGLGADFPSPEGNTGLMGMGSPMLGSLKKMLSVGKLNQHN